MRGSRSGWGCLTWTLVVLAAIALCLAVTFLWIVPSMRKSYTIDSVDIRAAVRADGALHATERFSYAFHGPYTRVYRDIPWEGYPITVLGVDGPDGPLKRLPSGWTPAAGEPRAVSPQQDATPSPWSSLAPEDRPAGYYRVTTGAFPYVGFVVRIEAFADLNDLSAAFTYRWRTTNAAERWKDAGELEWQLVGGGWDVPIGRVRAVVTLPRATPRAGVKAWGHGPLSGVLRVLDDGSVTLAVDDLPALTSVEVHALFPPDLLSEMPATTIDVVAIRLGTEQRLAARANEERAQARAQVAAARRNERIAWALTGAATAAALAVWFTLFFRSGREHRPRFRARYLREVPDDLPPALVGALWRMGTVTDADLSATLLDLAVKGVLRIEPDEDEGGGKGAGERPSAPPARGFRLAPRREKLAGIDELTRPLVQLLFHEVASGDSLTMTEMRKWAKQHPTRFAAGISRWRGGVETRARTLGFVEKDGGRAAWRAGLATGLAAVIVWVVLLVSGQWWMLAPEAACIVLTFLSPVMRRRSREAAELYARYRALYRYLRDFGRLDEKPAEAVVLWERYLVMAVVFGIADDVIRQMQVRVPQVMEDAAFHDTFSFAAPAQAAAFGGFSGAVSSFTGGLSAAVVAASPPSSGSGSGGGSSSSGSGFSGGGAANEKVFWKAASSITCGTRTCICRTTSSAMPKTTAITRYCSQSTTASAGFSSRRPKSRR